jgi:hypothetical protein
MLCINKFRRLALGLGPLLLAISLAGGCPDRPGGNDNAPSNTNGHAPPDANDAADPNTGGEDTDDPNSPAGDDTSLGESPRVDGVAIFPPSNPWNTDISAYPVHPNSAAYIASIGLDTGLHPDFGTIWEGAPIGIPYVVIPADQALVPVTFDYADESDPGPYPIPRDAPIEGGPDSDGDRHILIVDPAHALLYELFAAYYEGPGWVAGSGAIFDLTSNDLRPAGWTSADAAGLPIFPGLVRYDEVMEQGEIRHALRFTVAHTQRAYIPPATHFASSSTDPDLPPMGLRVRLKADFDISGFSEPVQVILRAMQRYGMLVADNGSNWYVSGAPDSRWDDDLLHELGQVRGRDFEAILTGDLISE